MTTLSFTVVNIYNKMFINIKRKIINVHIRKYNLIKNKLK